MAAEDPNTKLCECGCGQRPKGASSRFLKGHQNRIRHPMLRHGHARSGAETPTFKTWKHMVQRCNDTRCERYSRYGGRGIRVCDRWRSFENFLADMGEKPEGMTLDRIDNDGHYQPGNCRWASRLKQANNKSNNRIVRALGQSMTASEWERKTGVLSTTIRARIDSSGVHADTAVSAPPGALRLKTHCKRGHELSGDNVYARRRPSGVVARHCRTCTRELKTQRRGGSKRKLNADKAAEIRRRASNGERYRTLADDFGVSIGMISAVVTGHSWRP